MGVVYKAIEIGLDRVVALKVIAPEQAADPVFRERFVAEARAVASLDHPNVVPISVRARTAIACSRRCGSWRATISRRSSSTTDR